MFGCLKKFWLSFNNNSNKKILDVPDNPQDDNIDLDKEEDSGDYIIYLKDIESLYYPEAVHTEFQLKTRGFYKKNYPQGAVIHYTAGRSRNNIEGGKNNAKTHLEMGKRSIAYAEKQGSYCYFLIDRSGNVHQNFPLNRWGYHAGKSAWKGLEGSVSDELVGIEIQGAGHLSNLYNYNKKQYPCPEGKLAAWYTNPKKGDLFFDKIKEARYSEDNDNIQKGWYHSFSKEQEKALLELLIWLKINNPYVFDFDLVLGHDEVAGPKGIGYIRKSDPGASLSMTMSEFRTKVKMEYIKRYT